MSNQNYRFETYQPAGHSPGLATNAYAVPIYLTSCFMFSNGESFVTPLSLISQLANVSDAKTQVTQPSATTYQQLCIDEQKSAGDSLSTLRLSMGIGHVEDIIDDLKRGFRTTQSVK